MVLFIFRYHEIFFMIDTCQASSMYEKFYSPNILAMASSLVGEDSLSVRLFLMKKIIFPLYLLHEIIFHLFSFYKIVIFSIFQHHVDPAIGVYIIDRYTFYALKFLENVKLKSRISMKSFVSYF